MSIGGKLLLIPFKFFPVDIALVVIFDQYLPVIEGLVMAIAPARVPFLNHSPLLGLAVPIGWHRKDF